MTSFRDKFALESAFKIAFAGVLLKSIGVNSASAYDRISNCGSIWLTLIPSSLARSNEQDPSLILLALAEVIVPFGFVLEFKHFQKKIIKIKFIEMLTCQRKLVLMIRFCLD